MNPKHIEAFKAGLADRLAGRPMMAFGDARDDDADVTDGYCMGYDPHDELGLTLPEFKAETEAMTAELIRACCPLGVPMKLPRNRCEFPND